MTDITPELSEILIKTHTAHPIQGDYQNASRTIDSFLEEATRINAHISSLLYYLREVRQPYLSTAPPSRRNGAVKPSQQSLHLTDAQRDDIDSSTALLLQDLSSNIQSLTQAETLRQQTETTLLHKKYGKPNSILWRWAAGGQPVEEAPKSQEQRGDEGKAYTLKAVRESVLWYLGHQLQLATETQREMVEKRISREREKEKSILYKISGNTGGVPKNGGGGLDSHRSSAQPDPYGNDLSYIDSHPFNPATSQDETQSIESQLTPEQLQLFAQENSTLLNHYNDQLSKIQSAEKSLLEISSLQSTLISHLSTQGEMIEQLVTDAVGTDENIRKGNRQLQKASERRSTARLVFFISVGLCGFLIGWDLVF